jgi:hypothetical protein
MAAILTECGYMADVLPAGRGRFLLTDHNCALPRVARSFPVTCEEELCLIRDLVGASVSRVRHLLAGDLQCSYLIQPRSKDASVPPHQVDRDGSCRPTGCKRSGSSTMADRGELELQPVRPRK